MSGLEIAGVVLGSIPLLISALEHYQQGIRTVQRWLKYDREIRCLIRNLKSENCKLENVCEKLLIGLVPDHCIEAMVAKPFGELWQDKDIQDKVRSRLWRSFSVFERTVQDMNASVEEMKEKLGAGAETVWNESGTVIKQLKRASYTLNRTTYTEILTQIRDCVSNLESLIVSELELEPHRKVRSRVKLFSVLRSLSASVYRAVSSSLRCDCRHDMSMQLSTWTTSIRPSDDEDTFIQSLKMHLAVSSEQEGWEEMVIQAKPPPYEVADASKLKVVEKPSSPANGKKVKKQGVRFTEVYSSSNSSTSTTSHLIGKSTSLTQVELVMRPVVSTTETRLCRQQRRPPRLHWNGFICDNSTARARYFSIYPNEVQHVGKASMISLRELLESGQDIGYRQRLQLAVCVATGILHLHKTPWLPGALRSDNIYFIEQGPSSPKYQNAFVVAKPDETAQTTSFFAHPNPALLALGILLIELIRGQTIDSLRQPGETFRPGPDPVADFVTANRLVTEIFQCSSNYGSAVRRCINGEFKRGTLDLEDEGFRQEVYEGVVALLEEDLSLA